MRSLHVKVAGVTYEGRQEHIAKLRGNEPVRLVPEPENKFDSNAIAVHIAVELPFEDQDYDGSDLGDGISHKTEVLHCGYIPRELAKDIAPLLDGESFDCKIEQVTGGFELFDGDMAAYGLRLVVQLPDDEGVK